MDEGLHITVAELLDAIEWHMNNALASLATQNPERAILGLLSAGNARYTAELALSHMDELHGTDIQKFRAARGRASDLIRAYREDFHMTLNVQPNVKPTVTNVVNNPAPAVKPAEHREYHPKIEAERKAEIIALLQEGNPPDKTIKEWLEEIVGVYHVGYSTVANWYYELKNKK